MGLKSKVIEKTIIWSNRNALFFILLIGLLLRLAVYYNTTRFPRDEEIYIAAAELIQSGQNCEVIYRRPLLVPYCAAQVARVLAVTPEIAFRINNLIVSLALLLVGYRIAWEVFQDRKIALVATLFLAVQPYLLEISTTALREPFYWLFFSIVIYLGFRTLKVPKPVGFLLQGAATGLALLSRIEGVELLAIPSLVLLLHYRREGSWLAWLRFAILQSCCWLIGLAVILLLFALAAARYSGFIWYPFFWRF